MIVSNNIAILQCWMKRETIFSYGTYRGRLYSEFYNVGQFTRTNKNNFFYWKQKLLNYIYNTYI